MAPSYVAQPAKVTLPNSYERDTSFSQIRISHVPAGSPTVTPVVLVTLYRPKNNNAFTATMMDDLLRAYGIFDVDPRVKCIVVTGHGRMFCAGADLEAGFGGGKEAVRDHRDGGGKIALAVHRCRKPVIAAIQGAAVGVGITQTLPMTIRVAWEGAKIGFVFARRGLVMEATSSWFLPKLIGMSKALHLVTTGSVYQAKDPLLSGLFSELLPTPDAVLPRALEIASEIAANTSTVCTYLMRELMYRPPQSAEETHLLDSSILYELFSGRDNAEGVASFLEKRPAKFEATMEEDAPAAWPWWTPVDVGNRPVREGYVFKPKSKL